MNPLLPLVLFWGVAVGLLVRIHLVLAPGTYWYYWVTPGLIAMLLAGFVAARQLRCERPWSNWIKNWVLTGNVAALGALTSLAIVIAVDVEIRSGPPPSAWHYPGFLVAMLYAAVLISPLAIVEATVLAVLSLPLVALSRDRACRRNMRG